MAGETSLFDETRDRYLEILSPIFFPRNPFRHDIIRFFASVLRATGIEDKGWDPYEESRAILESLNSLMQLDLPEEQFNPDLTVWRLGLLLYNHIIEMSAPYEVIANLLRFQLEEGYSPNPFYKYMTEEEKKRFKRSGLYPRQKIEIIERLAEQISLPIGSIFDEFVRFDIRNAVAHADYVMTEDAFRCRGTKLGTSFSVPLQEMDTLITSAKAFASAFFILEREARRSWGACAGKAIPYDQTYKALLEILANDGGLMTGFKVHWPNGSESFYRRTPEGTDMTNCFLSIQRETIELFVGMYARNADRFSPLVERGAKPTYTPIEGTGEVPMWDFDAAAAKQPQLPEVNLGKRS